MPRGNVMRRLRRSPAVRSGLLLLPLLWWPTGWFCQRPHGTIGVTSTVQDGWPRAVPYPHLCNFLLAAGDGCWSDAVTPVLHCGYHGKLGMWNAFPHIKRFLLAVPHGLTTVNTRLMVGTLLPFLFSPTTGVVALTTGGNGSSNHQRINRIWGMRCISLKETLMRTLDGHFGTARCPFTPPTYALGDIRTSANFRQLIASRSAWLLKQSLHRGQGVHVVSSAGLLAADARERRSSSDATAAAPKVVFATVRASRRAAALAAIAHGEGCPPAAAAH